LFFLGYIVGWSCSLVVSNTILLVNYWVYVVLWSILSFHGLSILQISQLRPAGIVAICPVLWLLLVIPCYIFHSFFLQVTVFLIEKWLVSICFLVSVKELLWLCVLMHLLLPWIFLLFWVGPVLVVWLFSVLTLQMHFVFLLSISILLCLLVDLMVLQYDWNPWWTIDRSLQNLGSFRHLLLLLVSSIPWLL